MVISINEIRKGNFVERPAKLTQAFVNGIGTPGRYSDGRRAFGLTLLVKPLKDRSGFSKTYSQRLTLPDGKKKAIGLGSHPITTLKQARDTALANAQANRAAQGITPELRRVLADSPTAAIRSIIAAAQPPQTVVTIDTPIFADVADMTIEALKPTWKGNKSYTMWNIHMKKYVLPVIGDLPVHKIESRDIVKILSPIWTSRQPTAKQVKMRLAKIFDTAKANNWIEENPVDRASLALPKVKRDVSNMRAIPYQDIPEAMLKIQSVKTKSRATPDALIFMILTASRRDETRLATWDEIDMEARIWTIPAKRMKAGCEHRVPLSEQAIEVLERQSTSEGLIFSRRRGKPLGINSALDLLQRLGINSTVHGFRSCFRSWSEDMTDASHTAKEMALAHKVGTTVEQAYQRSDVLDLRTPLMQKWADYILLNKGMSSRRAGNK